MNMFWRNGQAGPVLSNNLLDASPVAVVEAVEPEHAPMASKTAAPLTHGRAALSAAIKMLRQANAARERATKPARRLDAILSEARRLDDLLAQHSADYERVLGAWLANGGEGERPTPAPETVGLRIRRTEIDLDLAAAKVALPGSREIEQQAAASAAAASCELAETIAVASREVAAEIIAFELIPAIEQVLRVEARLTGLVVALREAGDRPNNPLPGAIGISVQIAEMIREGKREPGIPVDIDRARRFLNELAVNAEAIL
jgi:hypothetical protein